MPPAAFRGLRRPPTRRISLIVVLVAIAAATAAGEAVAASSLRVTITARPHAASSSSSATFRWKTRGKVRHTLCSLDGKRFARCKRRKTYVGLTDGRHRFRVEVKGRGRAKKLATVRWVVDTVAPSTPVASGGSSAWQTVPSIGITAAGSTDAGSGLAGYQMRTSTDGGATWSAASAGALATITTDGETLAQFRALDKAGNASAWSPAPGSAEATARLDRLAPFAPTVSGGDLQWQNTSGVLVSAAGGADVGGAGFDHYEYRTSTDGGASWSAAASGPSVAVTADGETIVQFRSVDAVGNASAWAPAVADAGSTVRLDRTLPTDPVVTGAPSGWQNIASALLTASGSTDAQGAGIAFYEHRSSSDGGQTWSAPVAGNTVLVNAEGLTLVQFRSVDLANLHSAWIQAQVGIDRTNPTNPSVAGGSAVWQSVETLDIAASGSTDAGGSALAGYEYRTSTDGGLTWSAPAAGWDDVVAAEGQTLVQFRALDGAGNTSGWAQATARIDRTAPTVPVVAGGSVAWQSAPSVDVTASGATDSGGSGLTGYEHRTSTDNGQTWSSPTPGALVSVSAEGTTLVQFRAVDGAGNATAWAPAAPAAGTVRLDHTAPTLSGLSGGSLTWKSSASITITAGAAADAGGSGLLHVEHRTSADGGTTWTAPSTGTAVAVSAEGETLVQFRSVDNAGNTSAWLPAAPAAAGTVRLDRTAPTAPTVTGGSSTWQSVPSVLVSASASTDAGSGLAGYEYRTSADGGTTWTAASGGSSLSVSAQGATEVGFRAVDAAGRTSAWVAVHVRIDRSAPSSPAVTGGSSTWKTSASATVSAANSTDTGGSGFAGYRYETSTDSGASWSPPSAGSSLVVSSEGETLVRFEGIDNAGNESAWVQATVRLDRSAPTAPAVSGGSLGWQMSPATVSASGSTDTGGSGMSYQYRTSADNGATWSAAAAGASHQVSTEGTTLVQFRAIDGAGNASAWAPASAGASNTVKLDLTQPTAPTVTGGSASWQTAASVTIGAAGATDGGSGLAGYDYRTSTDGTTWSAPASGASLQVSAQGTTYVQFRSRDAAGNTSAWTLGAVAGANTVKLDRTAPVAPTVSGGSLTWQKTAVTLSATGASDPLSGLKGLYVRTSTNGGATWSSATLLPGTTYQVSAEGTTIVQFQSVDNAGNASAWTPAAAGASNTVKIDATAPTLPSASGGQGAASCRKHVTVSVVASTDAASGVAHYDYRVSTNAGSTWGAAVADQSSVSFSNKGTYYVQFRAVDNAGNISGWGPASPVTGSIACIR